jgi:uncharacterized repeat protein (TIGR01451 family)
MSRSHLGPRRPAVAARRPRHRFGRLHVESLETRTLLAVIPVTSTADAGAGTLRDAIMTSNASTGVPDTITFNIAGAGVHTISPLTALPAVTDSVTIDGASQPGFNGTPLIQLQGSLAGTTTNGLTVSAGGSTIKGLAINLFGGAGLVLKTNGNDLVTGCFIGVNTSGTGPLGNGGDAITISSSPNNTIGGVNAGQRNILSGNGGNGIQVTNFNISTPPVNNLIINNYIGTDVTGTLRVPNTKSGIDVTFTATNTTIGGASTLQRNLISGNLGDGVNLSLGSDNTTIQGNYIGSDATGTLGLGNGGSGIVDSTAGNLYGGLTAGAGNLISGNAKNGLWFFGGGGNSVVQGNLIGLDVSGTRGLANGGDGIFIQGSNNDTIGGSSAAARNVISANGGNGIETLVAAGQGSIIQGNYIGTDATGSLALGNVGHGIDLFSSNNTVGGPGAGQGNIIANTRAAVLQSGAGVSLILASNNNAIVGNSIFGNAGLGIDLGDDGVTQNKAGGPRTGPNNFQNFPVLSSVVASNAGGTLITGTLNSIPNASFAIDFYSNTAADPSTHGQGQTYLGRTVVTTDNGGNGSFSTTVAGTASVGQFITATATDALGNTSEFATDQEAIGAPTDVAVSLSANPSPVLVGQTLVYTMTVDNNGPNDAFGVTVNDTIPANLTFQSVTTSQGSAVLTNGQIVANLGTILVGQSATITLTVKPTTAAIGQVLNSAVVTATKNVSDTLNSNNTSNNTTSVNPSADLSVVLTSNPNPVLAGQPLTYSVKVTNSGPNNATGVVLADALPNNTTFVSATLSQGSFFTSGNSFTALLGNLAAGASATVVITATPSALAVGSITNTVIASALQGDPVLANNNVSISNTVNPAADLIVTIASNPNPVLIGQSLTYTVNVTNLGPSTATGIVLSDLLPNSVAFVSAVASQGSTSRVGTQVSANLGSLASGATATVTIVVQPSSSSIGSIIDSASVSALEGDPVTTNNAALTITTVKPASDLSIAFSPIPGPVLAGQSLTYVLAVSNFGPSTASGVIVTDLLPANVAVVSVSSSQGISGIVGSTVTATLGTLPSGNVATLTIVVRPSALAVGQIVDAASVTGNQSDPVLANNSTSTTTEVDPSSDVSIDITGAPDPVAAGQNLVYTITVTNNGPNPATGVSVVDVLPASLNFVSSLPSQGASSEVGGVVTTAFGSLAVGASATVSITVQATVGSVGVITNSASVSSTTIDPISNNDSASVDVTVAPAADLTITMAANPNPVFAGGFVSYVMTVTNHGPSPADGVVVSDTLPTASTFLSASSSQGTTSAFGGQMQAILGSIAVNGSATVTLIVSPTGAAAVAGTIVNIASVSSSEVDVNPGDNATAKSVTVNPASDLSVSISDSPDPVFIGGAVTYIVTVTNLGPNDATDVVVDDLLPTGTTILAAVPSQGSVIPSDSKVTVTSISANLGTIPFGSTATVTITVMATTTTGVITDQASVKSTVHDPALADNTSSESSTVVLPRSDLEVTITPAPSPVFIGESFVFTVNVVNNGPQAASAVNLSVPLPPNTIQQGTVFTKFGVVQTTGVTAGNGVLHAKIDDMPVGGLVTLTVQLRPTQAEDVELSGTVSGNVIDPDGSNNSVTAEAVVLPATPVSVSQTVAPKGRVAVGDTLTYTLVVTNNGLLPATDTTLTDVIPAASRLVSSSPVSFAQSGTVLTANLGTLGVGQSETVTIVVRTGTAGIATNTATVGSDLPNQQGATSTTVVSTTVAPVPGVLQFATSALTVNETDGSLTFTIDRVSGTNGPVSVNFSTANGTAQAGVDFVATSGSLNFGEGEFVKTFTIPILDAHRVGGTSSFIVTLSGPSGGVGLGSPVSTSVTIIDNDTTVVVPPPPVPDGPHVVGLVRSGARRRTSKIDIGFDAALNPISAQNLNNYILVAADRAGHFGTKGSAVLKLKSAVYNPLANSVTLQIARPLAINRLYQLMIIGNTPTGVSDALGHLLDGNHDGHAGSNYATSLRPTDHVSALPKGPAAAHLAHHLVRRVKH